MKNVPLYFQMRVESTFLLPGNNFLKWFNHINCITFKMFMTPHWKMRCTSVAEAAYRTELSLTAETTSLSFCLYAKTARPIDGGRLYFFYYTWAVLRWDKGARAPNLGIAPPQMWHKTLFDEFKASAYSWKMSVVWASKYAKMVSGGGSTPIIAEQSSRRSQTP